MDGAGRGGQWRSDSRPSAALLEPGAIPAEERAAPALLQGRSLPSRWWGMLRTSDDDGKTWSGPRRLPDGILGPIKNKPVQLAGGDLLCPSSTEHDGWRIHFERTGDLGRTWTRTEPLNDGRKIAAIQPSILFRGEVGGEKLLAIGRTRQTASFASRRTTAEKPGVP